jgi:hypothetical protein
MSESEVALKKLKQIEIKNSIREDVRRTHDSIEEGLAKQLREVVRRQQYGDRTADVQSALERLQNFRNNRFLREKDILEAIGES